MRLEGLWGSCLMLVGTGGWRWGSCMMLVESQSETWSSTGGQSSDTKHHLM